jgi:ATP synthase protein I
MNKTTPRGDEQKGPTLATRVGAQAARKLEARRNPPDTWFGLGMMGLIGWSVALPTLVGTAIGLWIDHNHPAGRSWTLSLLVAGLCIGCFNAWHWVAQEEENIREPRGDQDD